jgi:type V secretory pathway adhesin AidA
MAACWLLACGGGDDDSTTVNEAGTDTGTPTDSGDASTDAPAESSSTSTGAPESSSGSDPTAADGSTGTMGWTYCDAASAPFTGQPLVASLGFDFAAQTCSAMSGAGGPPQLLLEIQDSGLIDITAFGIEITDASAGLLFEDPPEGDSQVIDLYPGFVIRLEGTVVGDGSPIIVELEVTEKGPLLADTRADFG